jgi:hypothetical protein
MADAITTTSVKVASKNCGLEGYSSEKKKKSRFENKKRRPSCRGPRPSSNGRARIFSKYHSREE